MAVPNFSSIKDIEIIHFKTEQPFLLQRADKIVASKENLARIVSICNEPLAYEFLFRRFMEGKPYEEENAKSFLSWAAQGWSEKTHYVFLITNSDGEIHAAVDIQSNQLEDAEIGYLATLKNPGLVTNAIAALCGIGKIAGYKSFIGMTLLDNQRSAAVLIRNAFSDLGLVESHGKTYRKFRKIL
jgi:RimJ/RimL family protein N-acetyltransferase